MNYSHQLAHNFMCKLCSAAPEAAAAAHWHDAVASAGNGPPGGGPPPPSRRPRARGLAQCLAVTVTVTPAQVPVPGAVFKLA